jgi:RNA polymerase sigma-70 factor (ECF subfamily)
MVEAGERGVATAFDEHRRTIWGLVYRMTGDAAEADDIVQEVFVRALQRPPADVAAGWRPWLTRVAANLAIDAVRRRRRRDYVGPWLPSPIETGGDASPPAHEITSSDGSTEHRYDLIESVSMAFLLALERLTARQRAVLILRDVFDYSAGETATALEMSTANVKVTLHRARRAMEAYDGHRARPTRELQGQTAARLTEFLTHLQNGDVGRIEAMLAADARFVADGGGEFAAALRPILGREKVLRLLLKLAEKQPPPTWMAVRHLNGLPALVVEVPASGRLGPRYVLRFELNDAGEIAELHTVLAMRKLTGVRFGQPDSVQ